MDDLLIKPHLDSNGQDLAIETTQDVEDIMEWNKWARTEEQKSDWGRHVARIPNNIYVMWLNEAHAKGHTNLRLFSPEFDAIVNRKLKDPEWAYLRVDKNQPILGWSGVPI